MTSHSHASKLPTDILGSIAAATKRRKAGDAVVGPPHHLDAVIDAVLIEIAGASSAVEPTSAVHREIRKLLAALMANFEKKNLPEGASAETEAAVRSFGRVAAVGEFAIRYGILPWNPGEVFKATSVMIGAWIDPARPFAFGEPADAPSCSEAKSAPTDALTCLPKREGGGSTSPEVAELARVLDRMGLPAAVTAAAVIEAAGAGEGATIAAFLSDRANRLKIADRFGASGYEQHRNPDAKDGLSKVGKSRVMIYARRDLSVSEQAKAVRELIDAAALARNAIGQSDQ